MRNFSVNQANISVGEGHASVFNTIDEQKPGCPYSFGEIKTMSVRDTMFKSYYFYAPGYLETRVKLFMEPGQGAACWLWGIGTRQNPGTPGPWTEIDIFETDGVNANTFTGTYHWTYNNIHVSQNHKVYLTESAQPYDLTENWTTFGLEWDTAVIRWYVNNALVKELDLTRIPPFCVEAEGYTNPSVPFCVRFNSGNNTVGNQSAVANPAGFPQAMLIDYVRVYKKAGYKASPVVIRDGLPQICATATLPADSGKFIHAPYYPGVNYQWTTDAFELRNVASPMPQPPGKKVVWIRPGIGAGIEYPVSVTAAFPDGYIESDTAGILIAPGVPVLSAAEISAFQVDPLCRFTIRAILPVDVTGFDYSFDNGLTWETAKIMRDGAGPFCLFGEFSPGQQVSLIFRAQNSCGNSPGMPATLTMPAPPPGCTWPAAIPGPGETIQPIVRLAPNPVYNTLTVNINQSVSIENTNLCASIYDMHARRVLQLPLTTHTFELNLAFLKKGMYCLRLSAGSTPLSRALFLKN